jgi:hypothetical protein
MFLQPPPPLPRARPWWEQKQEPAAVTTLMSTTATTTTADVTEKQMAGRLSSSLGETLNPNQSDTNHRQTGAPIGLSSGAATALAKQDTQQASGSRRQSQAEAAKPANRDNNGSKASSSSQGPAAAGGTSHKRGTIITSASTSPGKGDRLANGARQFSSYQQQKQFRSLGASSASSASFSTSSSASPSLVTSMMSSRQLATHRMAASFSLKQIWPILQNLLPTIVSAILAIIQYTRFNNCIIRINHIVTIYSA